MPFALPPDAAYLKWEVPRSQTATHHAAANRQPDEAGTISARGGELLKESKASNQVGLTDNHRAIAEWIERSVRRQPMGVSFERIAPTDHDRRWFQLLVARWAVDTQYTSSTTKMFQHLAYKAIMRMGQVAVPLLLRELQREPNQWFHALKELTGADPVPVSRRGRLPEMTDAWLRWGRAHGIAW